MDSSYSIVIRFKVIFSREDLTSAQFRKFDDHCTTILDSKSSYFVFDDALDFELYFAIVFISLFVILVHLQGL